MISVKVKGEKKMLAPEEVSSMVLTKMKEIAEAYLGKEVRPLGCLAKKNSAETFTVTHTVAQSCHASSFCTRTFFCISFRGLADQDTWSVGSDSYATRREFNVSSSLTTLS